ncbi:MAG TPA: hypothetical protein VN040_07730 [Pseudosphingobacterium sp.]|nr:hypothetical protein [Pseudosphingobacterium sp.]
MRELRIKQQSGSSFIDFDPTHKKNQLLIVVNEWTSDEMKISRIGISLNQVKMIHSYLGDFLKENADELLTLQTKISRKSSAFETIYETAKERGAILLEELELIKELGIPILSLLAKDLGIPARELQQALKNAPLPFVLFDKHYESCLTHIHTNSM